jgi:hypothetical protein
VDLVALDRIGHRHAEVVVDGAEWEALAGQGTIRAALAWALKEAAAKATGAPSRCFPRGLRIARWGPGLQVRRTERPRQVFAAGWTRWKGYLCAWVWELAPGPGSPAESFLESGEQGINGTGDGPLRLGRFPERTRGIEDALGRQHRRHP